MKIQFTHGFIKIYNKRFPPKHNIHNKFNQRIELFSASPNNPILKDHLLGGKLSGYRAFSITGDIRVVYHVHNDTAYFADIGTHNQVYGK